MSMSIATNNPATGETLATFDPMTDDEADERIAAAHEAFPTYRTTTDAEQATWPRGAPELTNEERNHVVRIPTTDTAHTIRTTRPPHANTKQQTRKGKKTQ